MRLALGAAQFGFDYGVANTRGQITLDEADKILECAHAAGIDTIDTAINYGESESRLGEVGVESWHVVSKLPAIPGECHDVYGWVSENVNASLARLKISHLSGLLLHRPDQLLGVDGQDLYRALLELKHAGKVEKIGISIYEPSELDALYKDYAFDLVQAPFNVFDRRLEVSGWLSRLKRDGVEIHVRSTFLQGLLLSSAEGAPTGFERWESLWSSWKIWVADSGLSPLSAALGHVLSYPEIDRIIVGIDDLYQLNQILASMTSDCRRAPEIFVSTDLDLLNPSRWPTFL